MRGITKKHMVENFDRISRERDLWSEVAHIHIMGERPVATEVIDHSTRPDLIDADEAYVFHLYRVLRGHGGILVELHVRAGQATSANAHRFEDWIFQMDDTPYGIGISTERRVATDRLRNERRRIFESHTKQQQQQ